MEYNEFLENIKDMMTERLQRKSRDKFNLSINKISKNNGVVLDALSIHKDGCVISPNIYVSMYYDQYLQGEPLISIVDELLERYEKADKEGAFAVKDIMDFEEIKNDIIVRLVNYERNEETLEKCPYMKYLDLAITFRYMVKMDDKGLASALISNQEFEKWNVRIEELYELALDNTKRMMPEKIDSLLSVISKTLINDMNDEFEKEMFERDAENVNLYVLTNKQQVNGATCLLYNSAIATFADKLEKDVFILPSSLHEVMLLPDDGLCDVQFLKGMVQEANSTTVGVMDYLSDNVYCYDRETKKITVCEEV